MALVLAESTAGLDLRWFGGAPDLSESLLDYKDATLRRGKREIVLDRLDIISSATDVVSNENGHF